MASRYRRTNEITARGNSEQRFLWRLEEWMIPDLAQLVYDYTGDGEASVPTQGNIMYGFSQQCCACDNKENGVMFGVQFTQSVTVAAPECENCSEGNGDDIEDETEVECFICRSCIKKLDTLTQEFGGDPYRAAANKNKRTFSQVE